MLDLKDCFYTIPLNPADCKRFAFSVPSTNFQEPMKRYQWLVLPQGMANSPTLCQQFVSKAIAGTRASHAGVYIILYMDDILLAHTLEGTLLACYAHLQLALKQAGLIIAPKKVQRSAPYSYLGYKLLDVNIQSQKIELRKDCLKTLHDFQKLLGDINWLRPSLNITTGDLKCLFDLLTGDPDPSSPRSLTFEARAALDKVEQAIQTQQLMFCDYNKPLTAYIMAIKHTPTAVL